MHLLVKRILNVIKMHGTTIKKILAGILYMLLVCLFTWIYLLMPQTFVIWKSKQPYKTNVGLPEENTPHAKINMTKVINNYSGTANTLISYIAVPLFACATVIIDQYGLLSTHVWLPHSFTHSHNNTHTILNSLNHQSFLRANKALLSSTGGIWLCYAVLYAPCLFRLTYTSQRTHTVCYKYTWCLTVFLTSASSSQGTVVWPTHSHLQ